MTKGHCILSIAFCVQLRCVRHRRRENPISSSIGQMKVATRCCLQVDVPELMRPPEVYSTAHSHSPISSSCRSCVAIQSCKLELGQGTCSHQRGFFSSWTALFGGKCRGRSKDFEVGWPWPPLNLLLLETVTAAQLVCVGIGNECGHLVNALLDSLLRQEATVLEMLQSLPDPSLAIDIGCYCRLLLLSTSLPGLGHL